MHSFVRPPSHHFEFSGSATKSKGWKQVQVPTEGVVKRNRTQTIMPPRICAASFGQESVFLLTARAKTRRAIPQRKFVERKTASLGQGTLLSVPVCWHCRETAFQTGLKRVALRFLGSSGLRFSFDERLQLKIIIFWVIFASVLEISLQPW